VWLLSTGFSSILIRLDELQKIETPKTLTEYGITAAPQSFVYIEK
jgi:predicted transcriptional regulator